MMNGNDSIDELVSKYMLLYFKSDALSENKKAFVDNVLSNYDIKNFNSFNDIIDYHFILSEKTASLCKDITKLIRQFKKTSGFKYAINNGEVRGNIDWNKTFVRRNNCGINSYSSFVVRQIVPYEDNNENKVLYELMMIIYKIFNKSELTPYLRNNNKFERYYYPIKDFIDCLNRYDYFLDESVVYCEDKIIYAVMKSKRELYRKAAELLLFYRDCKYGDLKNIAELFVDSFLGVCEKSTKFELYWLFKILEENTKINEVNFFSILPRTTQIAEWEKKGYKYRIYHNCGKTKSVEFVVRKDDLLNSKKAVYDMTLRKIVDDYSDYINMFVSSRSSNVINRGRPDIIIEKYNKRNELIAIYLGEIKDTDSKEYVSEGLYELLEYMEFVRKIDGPLNSVKDDKIEVKGFICSYVQAQINSYKDVTWRTFGSPLKYLL